MKNIILIILVIISGSLWFENQDLRENNESLASQVDNLETKINDYSYALEEANSNIEQANSSIDDASSYAWSTYEEMGYALDNLEAVDIISEP